MFDSLFQRRILAALNNDARFPAKTAGPGRLRYAHIYAGTVPAAEVARRRKANRAARKARRVLRAA